VPVPNVVSAPLSDAEALALVETSGPSLHELMARAAAVRDAAWGRRLTYSPKVFLPVTNLCRNRCDYCAFRRSPGDAGEWTMSPSEIERVLHAALRSRCCEALLCLGDTPETAFPIYRARLGAWGYDSTIAYLEWVSRRALEIGLLPHTNAGILGSTEMRRLKRWNVSLGLMLENVSQRLCKKGMPHHRAPDKRPERRLAMLNEAGQLQIPFTTGILIGIGETARERVEALLAIRETHGRYGHIQEVIVQNFTPHVNVPMSKCVEPSADEMAQTVALARLVLPADVSVQAPPNLNPGRTRLLVEAGINDFGGISPLTPDYINPDRPWPVITALSEIVGELGFELLPRLPIYDRFLDVPGFLEPRLLPSVRRARQALGMPSRMPSLESAPEVASAEAGVP
jgi:FO synthase